MLYLSTYVTSWPFLVVMVTIGLAALFLATLYRTVLRSTDTPEPVLLTPPAGGAAPDEHVPTAAASTSCPSPAAPHAQGHRSTAPETSHSAHAQRMRRIYAQLAAEESMMDIPSQWRRQPHD